MPKQIYAARTRLGWSHLRLAVAADVPLQVVIQFELGRDTRPEVKAALISALEAAGAPFGEENGGI